MSADSTKAPNKISITQDREYINRNQKYFVGRMKKQESRYRYNTYHMEVVSVNKQIATVREIEEILIKATGMKGVKIKDISDATNISINTLYKWRTTNTRLSHDKMDILMEHIKRTYPNQLEKAIEEVVG